MEQSKGNGAEYIDEEDTEQQIPNLLKRGSSAVRNRDSLSMMNRQGNKGVTPFMRKKENVEDKARIAEITVYITHSLLIRDNWKRTISSYCCKS